MIEDDTEDDTDDTAAGQRQDTADQADHLETDAATNVS